MIKKITLLISSLFIFVSTYSQSTDKKINKMTFDMVEKKYEDVVYRAENLKYESEYRKNPWVHLYLAQGYYEIAKKPELQEEYGNAFKDALKAAYKFYKYRDESEEYAKIYQDHQAFLTELKDSAITLSEIYYDNENPRKAAYYLGRIVKFDEDDYAVWLMKGVYEVRSRNIGEGIKSIIFAMDSMDENYVPDPVSAQTLVDALEEYALIIKSGEYTKYFETYKFEVSESDVPRILAMKENFEKYVPVKVDKVERKKESEIIYKTFKSEDKEEDIEEEDLDE